MTRDDEHRISAFGITVHTGFDGGTPGFHRRAQIIRPGRVLYVLAEARDASGALELPAEAWIHRFPALSHPPLIGGSRLTG